MKVFELINFNRELLKKLQDAGIRLDDARYIDLYSDYVICTNRVKRFLILLPLFQKSMP